MEEPVADARATAVRAATPADVTQLTRALAAAFEDDPIFAWLLPDRRRRHDRLLRFFALELEAVVLPTGSAWMSPEASGTCLELPPGKWRMPLRTQALHAPHFAAVFGRSLPKALITITKMERKHLREPHLYVPYVGVAPEAQGAGLGTTLLKRTLERADAAALPPTSRPPRNETPPSMPASASSTWAPSPSWAVRRCGRCDEARLDELAVRGSGIRPANGTGGEEVRHPAARDPASD